MKYVDSKFKSSAFLKNYQVQKEKSIVEKEISKEDLEKFKQDPTRNPKTGRSISIHGKIYQEYSRLLNKEIENIKPKVIVKKLKDRPPHV
jgi:hypothetical protein